MERWLFIAGLLHIVILTAALHVPFVLQWKQQLAPLPPLLRRMLWIYGCFITLIIISFGVISTTFAQELADGSPLSRGVCGMIALFWLMRLAADHLMFPDLKPYMNSLYLRAGNVMLLSSFAYIACVHAIAAIC